VSAIVVDSAFSLSNETELLEIIDESDIVIDSFLYDTSIGASGDGNSLQKNSMGTWISALPTPGSVTVAMTSTNPPSEPTTGTGGGSSGGTTSLLAEPIQNQIKKIIKGPYTLTIFQNSGSFTNDIFSFSPRVRDSNDFDIQTGYYIWNMGDGLIYGNNSNGSVDHQYYNEGSFVLNVEWYKTRNRDVPDITTTLQIGVRDYALSLVFNEENRILSIKNDSDFLVDIGLWRLSFLDYSYILPPQTKILPSEKLMLSPIILQNFVDYASVHGRENDIFSNITLNSRASEIIYAKEEKEEKQMDKDDEDIRDIEEVEKNEKIGLSVETETENTIHSQGVAIQSDSYENNSFMSMNEEIVGSGRNFNEINEDIVYSSRKNNSSPSNKTSRNMFLAGLFGLVSVVFIMIIYKQKNQHL